jgi:hypothetical protein
MWPSFCFPFDKSLVHLSPPRTCAKSAQTKDRQLLSVWGNREAVVGTKPRVDASATLGTGMTGSQAYQGCAIG